MPGPYAHITLLNELIRPGSWLEPSLPSLPGFRKVLGANIPYCALGAVSPDYPNLVLSEGSSQWADAMHCRQPCEMISSGIRQVRGAKGNVREKQLAWLLGYCAHVVTDLTIHPVVQARVGAYSENQRQHRICEMNQDSYIYRRMGLGEIGESDLFALTVAKCSDSVDMTRLDRDIVTLWRGMLEDVHPQAAIANPPDIDSWHREFIARVSGCTGAVRLFPLAGVIASKMDLAYPSYDLIDRQFVDEQMVPTEVPIYLDYEDIFDYAVCNVAAMWRRVEQGVRSDDPTHMPTFGEWNLDTGLDEQCRLVFWK